MKSANAIVTGAAGGIGKAVVRALGGEGTRVAAVDSDSARLDAAVSELAESGIDVRAYPADVADSDAVETLIERVEAELGGADYLVNAAGVLRTGAARELPQRAWTETFAVNATGVFLLSRAMADRMVPRGRGAIVTVASNAAAVPRAGMSAYAASKAAATVYTKCLGLEVAEHGIRCNVVAPGSTDTPMLGSLWAQKGDRERTIRGDPEAFRVGIPLGRVAYPADIAEAVRFLLSERAGHITMHELTVDGGAALGA